LTPIPDRFGGVAGDNRVIGNWFGNYTPRPHDTMIAHIGQDDGPAADPAIKTDRNGAELLWLIFDQNVRCHTMLTT
jgi:hypothetical protein